MPDSSFEELIPIFSTRYSGDHLRTETGDETLRNLETRFTDHTRRIQDPWHGLLAIIALQSSIKSFIYVLYNLREPVRCSPKRKSMWQITQTPIFIQQRWRTACFVRLGSGILIRGQLFCFMRPEINFGFNSEFSRTHASVTCLRWIFELNWKLASVE